MAPFTQHHRMNDGGYKLTHIIGYADMQEYEGHWMVNAFLGTKQILKSNIR